MVHIICVVLTLVASHLHLTAGQNVCRDNNWTSGVHRHPDRCDYYVTCVNSVPSLYQCLKGLIFDTVLGTCAEPSIAHPCNESANAWPELTGDYQDFCNYKHLGTGVHLYPGTCDKFVYCTNSETFVVYCAVGHLYDTDYGACVEAKTAKSCSNDTNQNIIPGNFSYCQDNNWKNGAHSHPHTCIMYVVCSNYQTTVVPCQRGLLFDIKFRTCVDSKIARPCDDDPWSNITIAPQCRNISEGDILFILDSSSSIGYPNYKLQLRFVANLTQAFTIGPNNVQFGVVIFSEEATSVFRFDAYREADSLIQAINEVEYVSGPTFTDSALALAYQMFIPGAYGARANVPHIAIVLTDGLSANKSSTLLEAQKLKAAGVRVLGIGIGHFDQQELRGIASSQKEVFLADSYSVIHNLTDDITISLCKKVSIPKCTEAYADVILVMDASGSIGSTNFQTQLEFASNLVQNFPIGPDDVRFAALSFSTSVHKLFDLKTYNYANQMAQVFLRTFYDGDGTDTASALQYIRLNDMFGAAAGGRQGATKIIIVMTDGASNLPNQTATEAGILKDMGYHMMSIGIGSGVNLVELATLSTNVSNRFTVDNYDILSRLHEDVAGRACESR
ncbi:unnamed protein product [Lymnaea stagnalis]|uniref:Uncharacterized protein n=1 Tax=Lymnaea stagnalis TaxID=6523 RepID=A0AAV2HMQ1_LYMST